MARWIPGMRALCDRARRPAGSLLIALLLMAPYGFVHVRDRWSGPRADVQFEWPEESVVGSFWTRSALERENRMHVSRVFADRFKIPFELADDIHRTALEERIEPGIAFGLVQTESSFRRTVVSHAGAVGYTQLMPATARWMVPEVRRKDLFTTETNLRIGFRYLRYLLDKYDGDLRLALTAYNRGPGTVDRLVRRGRNPENGYARKVLSYRS